jgi:hypothetical protein
MLMKCADVSNPLRPIALARYWTDMVMEEQFLQVLLAARASTCVLIGNRR